MAGNRELNSTNHELDYYKLALPDLNEVRKITSPTNPIEVMAAMKTAFSYYFKFVIDLAAAQQLLISTMLILVVRECIKKAVETNIEERENLAKANLQEQVAAEKAYIASWNEKFEAEKKYAEKIAEQTQTTAAVAQPEMKADGTQKTPLEQINETLKKHDSKLQTIQKESHADFVAEVSKVTIYDADGNEIAADPEELVKKFEESKTATQSHWLQTVVDSALKAAEANPREESIPPSEEINEDHDPEDKFQSKPDEINSHRRLLPDAAAFLGLRNVVASLKMVHEGIPGKTANTPTVSNLEVLNTIKNNDALLQVVQKHVIAIQDKELKELTSIVKCAVDHFLTEQKQSPSERKQNIEEKTKSISNAAKLRELGGWSRTAAKERQQQEEPSSDFKPEL